MTNTARFINASPTPVPCDCSGVLADDALEEVSHGLREASACADYLELRIERVEAMHAYLRGKQVEHSFIDAACGGYVRTCRDHNWHTVQFEGLDVAGILTAFREAAGLASAGTAASLVPARSVDRSADLMHTTYQSTIKALCACNERVLSAPRVEGVQLDFVELHRHRTFMNSEQTRVNDRWQCRLNNIIPMIRSGEKIMNLWGNFCAAGRTLEPLTVPEDLVDEVLGVYANPGGQLGQITPGNYTVVLDPRTSGYLIHELLGHLMEADTAYDHPSFYEGQLKPGRPLAPEGLSVVDDPTIPGLAGSYDWDDEGVQGRPVELVQEGKVTGFMHTRDTARMFDVVANGHGRSIRFDLPPFARMSNTLIRPGKGSAADIFAEAGSGVYLRNCMFAKNDLRLFVLYPREAYRIEHGRVTQPLLPPIAYGDIFEILHNIIAIGDDLTFTNVGCTKGYTDAWMPVSVGGVHMAVRDMTLGGTFI